MDSPSAMCEYTTGTSSVGHACTLYGEQPKVECGMELSLELMYAGEPIRNLKYVRDYSAAFRWQLTSVAVLAEISIRSPRKLFIFNIKKYIFRIKVSRKKTLILKKKTLQLTCSLNHLYTLVPRLIPK